MVQRRRSIGWTREPFTERSPAFHSVGPVKITLSKFSGGNHGLNLGLCETPELHAVLCNVDLFHDWWFPCLENGCDFTPPPSEVSWIPNSMACEPYPKFSPSSHRYFHRKHRKAGYRFSIRLAGSGTIRAHPAPPDTKNPEAFQHRDFSLQTGDGARKRTRTSTGYPTRSLVPYS